jgi:hypothetical protein
MNTNMSEIQNLIRRRKNNVYLNMSSPAFGKYLYLLLVIIFRFLYTVT